MNTKSLLIALALLCTLSACTKSFKNANDDLRAERLELKQRVAELEAQLQQRLGQIESLNAQLGRPDGSLPGAEPPVFSVVKLDRYTGPLDADGDGRDDLIRLYVQTLDQRGRMLPVAGRANVQAVSLVANQPPDLYAEHVWEPAQFDAAYRTGFTGTHYTLELPLDDAAPPELTLMVTITSADGAEHKAQQAFRVTR